LGLDKWFVAVCLPRLISRGHIEAIGAEITWGMFHKAFRG